MKKLVYLLALLTLLTMSAFAQDTMSKDKDMGKSDKAASAPLKTLKGTVKAEGDKVMFVSDDDQKSWDVMNPETLKGHEGHHVQLKAHVYEDKNAIHVMSVKMMKEKGMKKDDSMKQ
jgi:hypothetical protein